MKEMYRIEEVAEILNFSPRTIRKWIIENKIKCVKIMYSWRIPVEEVERLKMGE